MRFFFLLLISERAFGKHLTVGNTTASEVAFFLLNTPLIAWDHNAKPTVRSVYFKKCEKEKEREQALIYHDKIIVEPVFYMTDPRTSTKYSSQN